MNEPPPRGDWIIFASDNEPKPTSAGIRQANTDNVIWQLEFGAAIQGNGTYSRDQPLDKGPYNR